MRVFINPGHAPNGVPDPGACGRLNGILYRESDIVREIGDGVAKYLENVGLECKVFQNDSLSLICNYANGWDASLFISIHANAGGGVGAETYCYDLNSCGAVLAQCIQEQIVTSCNTINHGEGVKEHRYYVLANTDMPAVLVETAFMDTEEDLENLISNTDSFARAIARGVTDYIESLGD